MADANPTDCPQDSPSSAEEDRKVEHGVLAFLLGEHPTHLTVAEVDRALNAGRQRYPGDAVERAVPRDRTPFIGPPRVRVRG